MQIKYLLKYNKINRLVAAVVILTLVMSIFSSCEEDSNLGRPFYDENELVIRSYLEKNDDLSECVKALERTGFSTLLQLAGTYTFFAPNNEAFNKYYTDNNISGLDQISTDDLTELMSQLIVEDDSIPSTMFPIGRLLYKNLLGDDLMTSVGGEEGNSFFINGILLEEVDVHLLNGIVHKTTGLIPLEKSLADALADNKNYSVFYNAMVETGIIDSIANISSSNRNRLTLLIETNEQLKEAGINSVEDLKLIYSNTEDLKSLDNGLNQYMRYHICDKYLPLNDIRDNRKYTTLSGFPINFNVDDEAYKLNYRIEYQYENEEIVDSTIIYQSINYSNANVKRYNGVAHEMNEVLDFYVIQPGFERFDAELLELEPEIIFETSGSYIEFNSDKNLNYRSSDVGEFIEFEGPYLFAGQTYQVHYQTTLKTSGYFDYSIFSVKVNGEMVGEPFAARWINDIGTIEVKKSGPVIIRITIEGVHLRPDDNNIRLKFLDFTPVEN